MRLAELIAALSMAADLGSGQPIGEALHSTVLAVRLGEVAGLDERDLADTYYASLLRWVGCHAGADLAAAVLGDERAFRGWTDTVDMGKPSEVLATMLRHLGEGATPLERVRILTTAIVGIPRLMDQTSAHCEVAQLMAQRLGLGSGIRKALGDAFERWNGAGLPRKLRGEAIALPMRVTLIAQEAEAFRRVAGVDAAVAMVRDRAGGAYDPHLAALFCTHAPRLFASRAEPESAWEAALAAEPGRRPLLIQSAELDNAIRVMADFTDLKTSYTVGHSAGVGNLAAAAAQQCGMSEAEITTLRHAGYLHDIGQAGISASVIVKPGRLNDAEWEQMRLHTYYTERVLARPRALSKVGAIAAQHHERLDGSGYHRAAPGVQQAPAVRLLAAAEAYHAMTEERAHRPALSAEAAATELQREAKVGRLDADAVRAVLAASGHRVRATRRQWPAGLSDREVEVLRLVARGLSNKQMGRELSISKDTAGHHVRHIYDKLGVSTRAAATLFAMQHDLLAAEK
jgi:HD-GYP domain-containing protein (c-di-GMP phosphodiesterase class II)